MKTETMIIGLAALLCIAPPGLSGAEKTETDSLQFAEYAMTEDHFRRAAAESPEEAVKGFFSPRAGLLWNGASADFSKEQLRDFFQGAVILRGAFNGDRAVTGYYNPWWDAILLTESSGLPEIPKVSKFYFLCGELFRGEAIGAVPDVKTVVPGALPLAIEAAQKMTATSRHFSKGCGTLENAILPDYPESRTVANMLAIQARSALRLKTISMLIKNESDYREINELSLMLRTGARRNFKAIFTVPENSGVIDPFLELDPRLRRGFVPYGYVPTAEGRLYLFVNGEFPRLFATMSLGGGWRRTVFEWYDLGRSEELLAIWNGGKVVGK